ncbi:MAG: hypothetical protein RLZZ447_384 [Verrucomicrobiota bacterium]
MPHVLVTGAAGFIGSHTVDQLLAAGHQVTAVDNFRTGRRENLAGALRSAACRLVAVDVSAEDALGALVAADRPDAIVHLAALVSVPESIRDPGLNFRLNVVATQRVAEAARAGSVRRVVFASSAAVYGEAAPLPAREDAPTAPISPYGAAKLASEALLLGHAAAYGFTVRCQRYFNVFGPRQDPGSPYSGVISLFARRHREGTAVTLYGDGAQTRDFISVHDVARANVLAATAPGLASGTANICTGRGTSLREVLAVFQRLYPKAPAPEWAPPRAGDILHSRGDPAAAATALGFRATVAVEDGLAELTTTE